jgi:hypothetical protein
MSEDIYSQFLRFTFTESANATFTGGPAVLTGASINRIQGQNIALEIHAIMCALTFPEDLPATGTEEYVSFAISTRSDLVAMPAMSDEHVIYRTQNSLYSGAGTYLPLIHNKDGYMPPYVEFKYPLLVSHTKLYPYLLSSNSSAPAGCYVYLLFTYVLLDADLAIEALEAFR